MKLSQKTRDNLRKSIHDKMRAKLQKQLKKTAVRKSVEAPKIDSFDPNDKEALAKYYKGAITGDWRNADSEHKVYTKYRKALGENLGTTGGFLVPTEVDQSLIELVRAKTVVRSMPGVRTYAMKSNVLEMPRMDSGATAAWGGENETIASSALGFGQVSMVLRKCVGKVVIPNELIEDADPAIVDIVNRDLTLEIAKRTDLGYLEGSGGAQPLGLYYQPNITWTDLAGTSPDWDDFYNAMYQARLQNHELNAWVSHPRLENSLLKLRTGDSQYLHPYVNGTNGNQATMPTLLGLPISYTTNIPITSRPDSNESYCIGADWTQVVIGDRNGLRLEASRDEAFSRDQTVVRAVYRTGLMLRHPEAVVLIKGISA